MTTEEDVLTNQFMQQGSLFPSENVSPSTKELPGYGVLYAKGIFGSQNRLNSATFWTEEEFNALSDIAQGRQSVDNIRKMFGYFQDPSQPDDANSSLAYIDIQVLNLAPKYINRAVDKIMGLQYDVELEVVDPVSVHEKKYYDASIKAYYELQGWLQGMGMDAKTFFEDLDVDLLPEYPDELMYEMLTNPKIKKAIDAELAVKLIHEITNFNQKMRMAVWDMVVYGRAHVEATRNSNGVPWINKINPKYAGGAYVENEDFDGQEYAFYFDFPTVNQFRKEASATMTEEEIESVILQYAGENNRQTYYSPARANNIYDGLLYIPVMRFYFLSEDKRVYVKRENQYGNETMMERGINWKPDKNDEKFMPGGNSEVISNTYTCVYGGTWVLDSEYVYDYGKKQVPRSSLVDVTLPLKTFAPNYKDGRTVSFAAQMIEPLFMINVAWNKIKEILAKGWMGYQEIDFTQLESVALGKGGKVWKPRDVYMHFLKTGRLIKRSPVNKHDQRYSSSAIDSNPAGLQLADYFTAFTTGIQMLEQMTGTTVAESVDQPDRLAVKVMQQSQATGDLDMGYLFNGYTQLYRSLTHQLILLTQEAKRDGVGIEGFISALGQHFAVPDEMAYCDLGLYLTRAPRPEEWAAFYNDLAIGLENGTITHLDSAYIREIKNLKKARQILGIRVKINERKAMQAKAQDQQAALEANQQAAQSKMQGDIAVIERQRDIDLEKMKLQAMIDEALMTREKELDGIISGKSEQVKKEIQKGKNVAEVIKEKMRSDVELKKVEKRPDKSPKD